MKAPDVPPDEDHRLRLLQSYAILDSAPESAYDDLVRLASHLLGTPIALISLVDAERQWFKARVGLDATETPRDISFCGHAVVERDILVVPDARQDPRFADNPLVLHDPSIRFYAGAPLRSDDGHVLGTLCVIDREPHAIDLEKLELLEALARQVIQLLELRRRAAQAERITVELREATKIQRRFFELSLDMLCVAGYDGYFKELNPAWSKVLGYSDEELKSRPFLDFVHPDDREATIHEAGKLATGEYETLSFENRYKTHDGSYRWLLWSASPDPDNELLMAVARDITPFKQVEQRLREAHFAAEAANRAKSEFLANMSHELRTPLNSVIGFTNILRKNKSGHLAPRELDYLGRIGTNGKHLLRLINDVLDLSKIEAGRLELQPQDIDVCELVSSVVKQLEDQAFASKTRLGCSLPQAMLPLRSDRDRLEQILINLVGNALKFAAGGTVEIRVHADADGLPLRVDVADDGVGIPRDKQLLVFESFRQAEESTRRRFGGSGLGLTISRSLCDMLGYRLELASELGQGSLFAVSFSDHALPMVYVPPSGSTHTVVARTVARKPKHTPALVQHKTVLVIDDDADARAVLESYLQDYGCQIVAADSGQRGIQLARQLKPDLITLDLMMPHLDGWAVLKMLGEDPVLRAIPVIICSIVGGENRASLAGAIAVVDKPVEREGFYAVLHEHLTDPSRGSVLVVEPNAERRATLEQWIEAAGARPCVVASTAEALAGLELGTPALAIVGMQEAMSLLPALRMIESTQDMPIVLHGSLDPALDPLPPNAHLVGRDLVAGDIAELLDQILDLVAPRP